MAKLTLAQLERHLLAAADILRGPGDGGHRQAPNTRSKMQAGAYQLLRPFGPGKKKRTAHDRPSVVPMPSLREMGLF